MSDFPFVTDKQFRHPEHGNTNHKGVTWFSWSAIMKGEGGRLLKIVDLNYSHLNICYTKINDNSNKINSIMSMKTISIESKGTKS